MMKVWFDLDCEQIISTLQDICSTCDEMFCECGDPLINEVKQHKDYGCILTYIDIDKIKTIRLYKREGTVVRLATIDDIEKTLLKQGMAPNFAYGVARITPLEHKVIKSGDE